MDDREQTLIHREIGIDVGHRVLAPGLKLENWSAYKKPVHRQFSEATVFRAGLAALP